VERNLKYQVEDCTIVVGQNQVEVPIQLDTRFSRCKGIGIAVPLDVANRINTLEHFIAIEGNNETLQDRVPAQFFHFNSQVETGQRLTKLDFPANSQKIRVKLDTNGVNVTTTNFVVRLIFELHK
jgi:hypothetical protein